MLPSLPSGWLPNDSNAVEPLNSILLHSMGHGLAYLKTNEQDSQ
jgi:hypothetical protein